MAKQIKGAEHSSPQPTETERRSGVRKIGRPYQVNGVWYYPHENPEYDETGIASWYGEPFHGRLTANGERYDMNDISAAHKTLPLPTNVRVTNLENGRSIVVRVNDRGPFVNGRIIDLSRRGAQLLGFHRQGTAKVRVQLEDAPVESAKIAEKAITPPEQKHALPAVPRGNVAAQQLPPPPGTKQAASRGAETTARVASADERISLPAAEQTEDAAPEQAKLRQLDVAPSSIFVQAGAFSQAENANKLRAQLSWIGPSRVSNVFVGGQEIFRVRIGPLAGVTNADAVLQQVLEQGIMDAHIIVN